MSPPAIPLHRLLGIFMLLALLETAWLHTLQPLENRLSDAYLRDHARRAAPDPDLVIVDIDDPSLARMQGVAGNWPWPRAVHGELVQAIAAQQPAAIVFDLLFSEQDTYRPDSDRLFNQSLDVSAPVFFPMIRRDPVLDPQGAPLAQIAPLLGIERGPVAVADARIALIPPLAIDPAYWRCGTINFEEDADGIGRRYRLYSDVSGWRLPSLPARVARDLGYPLPPGEDLILSWRNAGGFRHVSYAELYADLEREHPLRPQDEFRGKVVIIGTAATGLHDVRATPLSSLHPGMEILATALDNLKNGRHMQAAPVWSAPLLALLLIAAVGTLQRRRGSLLRSGALLALATLLLPALAWWVAGRGWLLPVLAPLLLAWAAYFASALAAWLHERREREQAVQLFSRFVNPHVVNELIAHGGLSRAGESREVTVMFSDIRGFTTLSERHTPQQVVDLLNRYFSLQVEVIFRHGGSLDKFIGDAIMAYWGAPLDDPEHARHAVAAALEMADTLQRFKAEIGLEHLDFDVGIGLHSGPAVVGLIGPEQRREYTAIGDTVNLASRIEGLTKGRSRILVSRDTMLRCGDSYAFRSFGLHKAKGREQEVELFAPERKGDPA